MRHKRIAVLVSGGGTNLQALIDSQQRGELGGGEIVAVISSKADAYALERAAKAGIPGYVLPRKEFESNQAMTVALVKLLKELNIDLVKTWLEESFPGLSVEVARSQGEVFTYF